MAESSQSKSCGDMAELTISDRTAKLINNLRAVAGEEKARIADALTTASDAKTSPIEDEGELLNLCSVLGRYNRLLSLLTSE